MRKRIPWGDLKSRLKPLTHFDYGGLDRRLIETINGDQRYVRIALIPAEGSVVIVAETSAIGELVGSRKFKQTLRQIVIG